ncbi:VOC family protein [Arthrobacter russicus]|jgi:predicted enzyme related to lactoylglutathione lyase|uniref:Enzyme related to lactoylglutathione lyase n=1 Tax=Arthrobacter russicus TaxID=172040 RepID=A0ABU1J6B3_9MICC|nr:VOC family protein [Arthrobacter russicus]MDR6267964.1 putative enzyme related to lactoylglutathione lyase [Arthrobacter russicus]
MAGIVWWEVETDNPELFQHFHGSLFGWRFEAAFADTELGADYWVIKDAARDIGGLQRAPSPRLPTAGNRVYLLAEDLEATLARAAALGGVIERSRTALGGADRWFGTFLDPTGISFGLWTPNARA